MSDTSRPGPSENAALKGAKIAVIILSALIILALIGLVVGAGRALSGPRRAAQPASFALAPGAHILAMDSQPGRLILRIRTATGEEVDILDIENGRLVGQVKESLAKSAK